jgi:molybdopterin/thiamine biosynthesis adenylyltransferase
MWGAEHMNERSMTDDNLIARIRELGFNDGEQYGREAFSRNLGLINQAEQRELARATVAIPGVGGVGGIHLVTLARAGVGRFHIADFDEFEPGNVNRQYGAKVSAFGRSKLETMAREALDINPFLELRAFPNGVNDESIDDFLDGVDVVVDSLDFFAFDVRRMLFNRAREKGLWVVSAGPIGFSSAYLVFAPDRGMSFDEYFDVDDDTDDVDKIVAFLVGLTPRTKYMSYMDMSRANRETGRGPSLGLACQLAAGVAATETLRILLGRKPPKPAPNYAQFDPYLRKFFRGYLWFGNRHPWQRIKRRLVRRMLLGRSDSASPRPPVRDSQASGVTRQVLGYVVRAGVQAPSGDNAQPWKFALSEDSVDLFVDPKADPSFFNFRQLASLIACGAAAENMRIAAAGCGFSSELRPFPAASNPEHVATIRLLGARDEPEALSDAIWERHTNRTMYRPSPLLPAVVDALEGAVSEFPGASIHVVGEAERLRRLLQVVQRADRLRVMHRGLHEYFHSMVRYSRREAEETRDGFPLANLEAGFMGNLFLRMTKPWPLMWSLNQLGFGRVFSAIAARGLQHCSGAALVTAAGFEPAHMFEGGRALERAWLTLTDLGQAVQPMTAITIFWLRCQIEGDVSFSRPQRKLLHSMWQDYRGVFPGVDFDREGHVMLFRFGIGRPVSVRTLRKPIDDFIIDSGSGIGDSGPRC